jgi:hypothetical protein
MTLTGLASSMAVNALVTGLIVFKILRVFLEVKKATSTSVNPSGTYGSTGGAKLQHIIFIIIESGVALFAIQLARVVITILDLVTESDPGTSITIALDFVIVIHEMLNVIIRSVHFYLFCFTDNIYLARALHQQ